MSCLVKHRKTIDNEFLLNKLERKREFYGGYYCEIRLSDFY
jgi:hypothetical protein